MLDQGMKVVTRSSIWKRMLRMGITSEKASRLSRAPSMLKTTASDR